MSLKHQRINRISDHEWVDGITKILHGDIVVLFCFGRIAFSVVERKGDGLGSVVLLSKGEGELSQNFALLTLKMTDLWIFQNSINIPKKIEIRTIQAASLSSR